MNTKTLVLTVLLAFIAMNPLQAQTGLSGKIVYTLNGDLWLRSPVTVGPAGQTGDLQLTATPNISEFQPRFSPDGNFIAANANGIRVLDLSGNIVATLSTSTFTGWPTWSADGQWIVWMSFNKPKGIFVARSNGSTTTPIQLLDHGGFPVWSPVITVDSAGALHTSIAFTSNKGIKPSDNEIWLMNVTITGSSVSVDAPGAKRVVTFSGNDGDLDWQGPSPLLTFTHHTGTTYSHDIYTIDLTACPCTGTAATRLTQLTSADVESRWSPDGTKLLFRRTTTGDSALEGLWVIDAFLGGGGSLPVQTQVIQGGGQADWGP